MLILVFLTFALRDEVSSFVVTPQHLNGHGTLFGGEIFSRMDQAAGLMVRKTLKQSTAATYGATKTATVDFLAPAIQGDVVFVSAEIVAIGKKSFTLKITMEKDTPTGRKQVAMGTFVFVAVKDGTSVEHGIPEKVQEKP